MDGRSEGTHPALGWLGWRTAYAPLDLAPRAEGRSAATCALHRMVPWRGRRAQVRPGSAGAAAASSAMFTSAQLGERLLSVISYRASAESCALLRNRVTSVTLEQIVKEHTLLCA